MKHIKPEGSHTEDPSECANILNSFFINQFCAQHQLHNPTPTYSNTAKVSITISYQGILNLMNNLKSGKSPGPDEIRKEDLTIDTSLTAKCLSVIFNVSLCSSKLPTIWILAHVTPLHKKDASDLPNNYRPISLTCILCKMMEHIVLRHLNITLDKVLHNRQHGFRKGLLCEMQLCGTYHEIARNTGNGYATHAVVLDFPKVFDKVPHQLLMNKLSQITETLMWIHKFLSNRKQKVVIKGHASRAGSYIWSASGLCSRSSSLPGLYK